MGAMAPVMFRSVAMTLGDAFNRRKKLGSDLQAWINRLGLAGTQAINQANKTELVELD